MPNTTYGDISPRTAAYVQKDLLKRGTALMCLEKFGQGKPIPTRNTKSTVFRRYEALTTAPVALTEGVTPAAKTLTHTDIPANLTQYGDLVTLTDVVMDTHEDPVLMEAVELLGEQAPEMIEIMRWGVVGAGTNVFYANGVARAAVNSVMTLGLQRSITRSLNRQRAKPITRVIRSTPSYGTEAVAPSYVAITHTDVENDIRDIPGFVPVEKYGSISPYEGEIGKVENCRYIVSPIYTPFADAGGLAATNGTLSTTGTASDVYPILFIGQNAYGIVPLKGKNALTPMVVNPKPSDSDPMAQRGHASWKSMQTAVILNDLWMARAEVAVSA